MKLFEINGRETLALALFTDVTNSKELVELMQAGTLDPEVGFLNATLVRPLKNSDFDPPCISNSNIYYRMFLTLPKKFMSQIPDVFPVLAAAHKTLVSKSRDALRTRTPHSELVYTYSGSKHISESLKRCGISENTSYILVARFNATTNEMKAVEELVKGKEIDLEELMNKANQAQILKHYKITSQELAISSLADAITCRIAVRDAL
ncbi:unnamed protein product [Rhodiola kirilowii]